MTDRKDDLDKELKALIEVLEVNGYHTAPTSLSGSTIHIEDHCLPEDECKCPIKDLLSNGHNEGCKGKK